ncbi:cupredoxin domain-containing protein [Candidatus Nitrospira inopinata]|uniref:EfeO-type cupredoxin-like domain-containing protein n=1 Tax=Candidatus Nitrospira inopinata TaxID=1715989 RepID=A0A0S4KQI3_9BACT|nr:hypothetical protein [Candidatus Nitrospira inopinata]CUQ65613.1 conserved exported protein of unknown function [Candidatus Nitrospira inopinata]
MNVRRYRSPLFAMSLAIVPLMAWSGQRDVAYAQAKGMEAPPSKVEITIRDRQHGYETVGITMPSHDTIIVVRNQDSVTHGFASALFKDIPVKVEGGTEVRGKQFRSFHVDAGKTMTLRFATAPSNFDPLTGGAESIRHALWCDIHPEVKGELFVIETRGEIGGG